MNTIVVGIADCKLSNDPDSVLVTYALGSCIGLAIHDPVTRVGGLLHIMLPDSELDREKAAKNPFMFADTGVPLLFRNAYGMGAEKRRLVVRMAGGSQVMDSQGVFNIGKRNALAVRKILWKAGVMLQGESTGGESSRTLRLEVATGTLWMRGPGQPEQDFPPASRSAGRST